MKTFTYIDYTKNREVIFTCEANSILDADVMLFEKTGIKAEKNSNIGCEMKSVENNNAGPKMK